MNIAWFTPFSNKSAIGKVSKKICEELNKSCHVDIWTQNDGDLIETDINIIYFDTNTKANELRDYDYIIYNMGNYAGYHKGIYEMSQKKPGIMILHDQTMYSFWAEYCLMSEFGLDNNQGFNMYIDMFRQYYGDSAAELAIEAIQSGQTPIYQYKTMPDYKLIGPIIKNAVGVFTHAEFLTDRIREIYNGPVSYSYLPCEEENKVDLDSGEIYEIIGKAKSQQKLLILSNGMVQPLKHIDKVTNVLRGNKELAKQICYLVIGSYHGAYGEDLERLSKRELKDCFHLLGFKDDNEMHYALQNVDVCMNLRYPNSEACSLSLLEQMSYGKPVIAINSGIYGEMPDNCVIKIPLENEEAELEEALLRILNNRDKYKKYGDNARAFIQQNCNVNVYSETLIHFLKNLDSDRQVANLMDRMIHDIGYKLNSAGFTNETVPSTIRNVISQTERLIGCQKAVDKKSNVIGIWAGFLYSVSDLKKERHIQYMNHIIDQLIKDYRIRVEVWGYSMNEKEIMEAFYSLDENSLYKSKIQFITEKNWSQHFNPNPENLSYGKKIDVDSDNLCEIARDYSEADCFITLDIFMDNVLGTDKRVYVFTHDMMVDRYIDFIKSNPHNKSGNIDMKFRVENLARNQAWFITNFSENMENKLLEDIRNLNEEKLIRVDRECETKEYYNLFFPLGIKEV